MKTISFLSEKAQTEAATFDKSFLDHCGHI